MFKLKWPSFFIAVVFALSAHFSVATKYRAPSSDFDVQSIVQSLSSARKDELKQIQNNFLRYMVAATKQKPAKKYQLFQEAREYALVELEKVAHNQMIESKSENNYKTLVRGHQWTLEDDIAQLTKQTKGLSQVDPALFQHLPSEILPFENLLHLALPDNEAELRSALIEILKQPTEKKRALALVDKFEEQILLKLEKIQNVGTEMTRSDALKLGNPDIENFVRQFLDFYYREADPIVLKNILNDLIGHTQQPSSEVIIKAMFRNSGPGLGKLLQQIGQEPSLGANLSQIMQSMESDNKKVPLHLIREVVQRDTAGYIFVDITEAPLGTGTMAQVNKAVLETQQGDQIVALRFLKPGVQELAEQDIKILDKFLAVKAATGEISPEMLPSVQKIFKSLQDFLRSELDIQGTIDKQIMAHSVYSRSIKVKLDGTVKNVEISIPQIYMPESGRRTQLHVQEFMKFGYNYSHLPEHQQKQMASRAMVQMWYEEALFQSGYIHADLHQGNFTVLVHEESNDIKINIFDFGMSDVLDEKTKRAFLLLGAGSEYQDAHLISKGFHTMMTDQSHEAFVQLLKLVKAETSHGVKDATSWIIWGLQNGVVESEQLGSLARGSALLQQLPQLIGEEKISKKILEQAAAKHMRSKIFHRHFDFPLKRRELLRLGSGFIKKSCQDLIQSFFK